MIKEDADSLTHPAVQTETIYVRDFINRYEGSAYVRQLLRQLLSERDMLASVIDADTAEMGRLHARLAKLEKERAALAARLP